MSFCGYIQPSATSHTGGKLLGVGNPQACDCAVFTPSSSSPYSTGSPRVSASHFPRLYTSDLEADPTLGRGPEVTPLFSQGCRVQCVALEEGAA